jgi:hypothetical protein
MGAKQPGTAQHDVKAIGLIVSALTDTKYMIDGMVSVSSASEQLSSNARSFVQQSEDHPATELLKVIQTVVLIKDNFLLIHISSMNFSTCQTLADHGVSRGTTLKHFQWAFVLVVELIQFKVKYWLMKYLFVQKKIILTLFKRATVTSVIAFHGRGICDALSNPNHMIRKAE